MTLDPVRICRQPHRLQQVCGYRLRLPVALQHNHVLLHLVNDVPLLQLLLPDVRLAQEATATTEASAEEGQQRRLRGGIPGRQDPARTGSQRGSAGSGVQTSWEANKREQ